MISYDLTHKGLHGTSVMEAKESKERNSFECLSNGSLLLTQQEGPLRGSHNVYKPGVHKCLSQFKEPFPSSDHKDDI